MDIYKEPIHSWDVIQGTDDWNDTRRGIVSASNASKILGKRGKSEMVTYSYKLAAERLTDETEDSYKNANMERGNEIEDQARAAYELKNDIDVEQLGFIQNSEWTGASPDGLIDLDGMVEIKCPLASTHAKRINEDRVPPEYIAQMQMQMWVSDRQWNDFVSFHPSIPQKLFTKRLMRNNDYINDLIAAADLFITDVEEIMAKCNG